MLQQNVVSKQSSGIWTEMLSKTCEKHPVTDPVRKVQVIHVMYNAVTANETLATDIQHMYTVSQKVSQNIFHHNSNKRESKFIKTDKYIRLFKLIKVIDNDPPNLIMC